MGKIEDLQRRAAGCRACDVWQRGTRTVFAEGEPKPSIMLVGEQPGDEEDRTGRPFVGPAGRLLDRALAEAGIDRQRAYVTNAVKTSSGSRATASQALLGRAFRVSLQRGQPVPSDLAPFVLATVHPSSILRAPDEETRHREYERFVEDLRAAARLL
jgi:uracil-DNA glycosylase